MSITWGPAMDAEVSYRQQQVRAEFRRATGKHFFHRRHHSEPVSSVDVTAMPLQETGQPVASIDHRRAA